MTTDGGHIKRMTTDGGHPTSRAKNVPESIHVIDTGETHRVIVAAEIADFVKAQGRGRLDSLADIIRRRWGSVESHPAEGG